MLQYKEIKLFFQFSLKFQTFVVYLPSDQRYTMER
jgi:hypothetical protein